MKRLSFIIALMILFTDIHIINSQPTNYSGWFFQNPLPGSNTNNVILFPNTQTGFVIGGNVIKTTNNGINWIINYDLANYLPLGGFISSSFPDINTGYITNIFNKYTLKTTNSGNNWIPLQNGLGGNSIVFPSVETGYLIGTGGGGYVTKTTNAGINWDSILVCNAGLNSGYFINNSTGFAVGWGTGAIGTIAKTSNAGVNWSIETISPNNFYAIQFTGADTGYCVGYKNVYKTTNTGGNWYLVRSVLYDDTRSLSFVNSKTGYVASLGSTASIYKTTDGGLNWTTCISNYRMGFQSIYFVNKDSGYALCGLSDDILFTTNGGANWHSQVYDVSDSSMSFQALNFVNDNTGFCFDNTGRIYKTTNGGDNWLKQNDKAAQTIHAVSFTNINTGYTVGNAMTLLKTTNCGINWFNLNTGSDYSDYWNICFTDSLTLYIAGTHGGSFGNIILKTSNGGANWATQITSLQGDPFYSISFINSNTGFAAGSPKIYKTTNAGNNWEMYKDLSMNLCDCQYNTIKFINATTGFIAGGDISGFGGILWKTTDGGETWFRKDSDNMFGEIYSLEFTDQNTGFACGSFGNLFKTNNNGENWYKLLSGVRWDIHGIKFTNPATGYIAGQNGSILKTTNGGGNIIGIQPVSNSVPSAFSLQQNYPNPFNPNTVIKFQVASYRFVKLVVYDLLGRELATLVNENLKPGTYEYEWDGTNYASGVYFYSLITDRFIQTKKMVLIK